MLMPLMQPTATLGNILGPIGMPELIVLLVLGLLLFGRRLPEVGRSLGKGIVEFRKGLAGLEKEVDEATHRAPAPPTASLPEGERVAQPPRSATIPSTPGETH
jgi:sec-independent protein translocase protein TatA